MGIRKAAAPYLSSQDLSHLIIHLTRSDGLIASCYTRKHPSTQFLVKTFSMRTFRDFLDLLEGKDEHVSVPCRPSVGIIRTDHEVSAEEPTPSPPEEANSFLLCSHFTSRRIRREDRKHH
ncbi:hypothetical protein ILYODFUR_025690 [Ilyodon furcidens]|uniref:Uncharacterized protein n=1 Tax=Ilyodon furcidens TaxID=33524 RepID=A0ABV0TZG7_9TELE